MNRYAPEAFFDLEEPAAGLFKGLSHVWQGVAALPAYIEKILQPGILGEVEDGAWLEPGKVQLGPGSRVERGAIVRGPAIIGADTVIRSGAYLRGYVLVGDGCVIGWGTELRQVLMLNHSKLPHLNLFFTSLVGNRVQVGGGTFTANFLLSRRQVEIFAEEDGQRRAYPTGLSLFGAVLGDDFQIGAQCLLQPGTVIGRRCLVYPQCTVSGYVPPDSLVRPTAPPFEVVPRAK